MKESSERTPINSKSYDEKLFEMLKSVAQEGGERKGPATVLIFQRSILGGDGYYLSDHQR